MPRFTIALLLSALASGFFAAACAPAAESDERQLDSSQLPELLVPNLFEPGSPYEGYRPEALGAHFKTMFDEPADDFETTFWNAERYDPRGHRIEYAIDAEGSKENPNVTRYYARSMFFLPLPGFKRWDGYKLRDKSLSTWSEELGTDSVDNWEIRTRGFHTTLKGVYDQYAQMTKLLNVGLDFTRLEEIDKSVGVHVHVTTRLPRFDDPELAERWVRNAVGFLAQANEWALLVAVSPTSEVYRKNKSLSVGAPVLSRLSRLMLEESLQTIQSTLLAAVRATSDEQAAQILRSIGGDNHPFKYHAVGFRAGIYKMEFCGQSVDDPLRIGFEIRILNRLPHQAFWLAAMTARFFQQPFAPIKLGRSGAAYALESIRVPDAPPPGEVPRAGKYTFNSLPLALREQLVDVTAAIRMCEVSLFDRHPVADEKDWEPYWMLPFVDLGKRPNLRGTTGTFGSLPKTARLSSSVSDDFSGLPTHDELAYLTRYCAYPKSAREALEQEKPGTLDQQLSAYVSTRAALLLGHFKIALTGIADTY